jgi:hypothetical protein
LPTFYTATSTGRMTVSRLYFMGSSSLTSMTRSAGITSIAISKKGDAVI